MNYKTNIRLIDTHAKCNGGNNYLYIFVQKKILPLGTQFTIQPGVIGYRFYAIRHQHIRQFFGSFPVKCINDTAFSFVLRNETYNAGNCLLLLYFWQDLVI